MAAARAAATLSAAADGLTGVVVLAALLVVAEDDVRAKLDVRAKYLEVLEVVPVSLLLLPAEDEAVLAVVVVVVVALLAGALGTVLDVVVSGCQQLKLVVDSVTLQHPFPTSAGAARIGLIPSRCGH